MIPVLMPQVGENLATGTVLEWQKAEGDHVARGEVLLTVESEKAVFEVQAEAEGVLARILVREGEEGAVLEPVGYIAESAAAPAPARPGTTPMAASQLPRPASARDAHPPRDASALPSGVQPAPAARAPEAVSRPPDVAAPADSFAAAAGAAPGLRAAPSAGPPQPPASPAARRRARELGVDLSRLAGTGTGGRIVVRDVLAAASGGAAPSADQVLPFSRRRRHIAARTGLSRATIPHLYLFAEVDLTAALERHWPDGLTAGADLALADLVIHALARALSPFPRLNGHVEGQSLVLRKAVHVGVAAAAPDGLLLPVVADAGRRSLQEIAALRRRNGDLARRGVVNLGPRATITLADLSAFDIRRVLPLINPPECAVLALGAVQERVVARRRQPVVRDVVDLTLGCDHRVVDADYGAGFLERLKALLEQGGAPAAAPARSP